MLITVVTVCLNAADTIAACLASVGGQTWPDVEHIVVDGGSSDGTLAILRDTPHRIRFVSEPDNGIYDAMNKGVGMASGEVVGLLNADDMLAHAGVLERVAAHLAEEHADCCYGDIVYVKRDDPERVVRHWVAGPCRRSWIPLGWYPPHPTFYARRCLYEKYGGYDTAIPIAADADLMIRLLLRDEIRAAYIPEGLVKMRLGGLSTKRWRTILRQNYWLYRSMRKNGVRPAWLFVLGKIPMRINQCLRARWNR